MTSLEDQGQLTSRLLRGLQTACISPVKGETHVYSRENKDGNKKQTTAIL